MADTGTSWFAKADLSKYVEKYIAIVEDKIVVSGKDPEEIYAKASEKHPNDEIILWKVMGNEALVLTINGERK